jgi:hypothetical protein
MSTRISRHARRRRRLRGEVEDVRCRRASRREAVAQPFGLRVVAVTGVIALTVSSVVRACSGPGGGEVVAVQLGQVVGRHQ